MQLVCSVCVAVSKIVTVCGGENSATGSALPNRLDTSTRRRCVFKEFCIGYRVHLLCFVIK